MGPLFSASSLLALSLLCVMLSGATPAASAEENPCVKVERCRWTVSNPILKAPMVSALS